MPLSSLSCTFSTRRPLVGHLKISTITIVPTRHSWSSETRTSLPARDPTSIGSEKRKKCGEILPWIQRSSDGQAESVPALLALKPDRLSWLLHGSMLKTMTMKGRQKQATMTRAEFIIRNKSESHGRSYSNHGCRVASDDGRYALWSWLISSHGKWKILRKLPSFGFAAHNARSVSRCISMICQIGAGLRETCS